MNTKPLPIAITLAASFVTCMISILSKASFEQCVIRFALTALIFYIIGSIIRVVIDRTVKADLEEMMRQKEAEEKAGEGQEEETKDQSEDQE